MDVATVVAVVCIVRQVKKMLHYVQLVLSCRMKPAAGSGLSEC